ncbi:hypothetical protein B7494_g865 [Chlorociboria aeruginascens]|nr:hypothetical protein B7494_g865 [Chlorociboria aeruginascens]
MLVDEYSGRWVSQGPKGRGFQDECEDLAGSIKNGSSTPRPVKLSNVIYTSTMPHSTRASLSSDGLDSEYRGQFEPRQRQSSVGNFDSRSDSPMQPTYARNSLNGHWPWEQADILTPTPPEDRTDMLTLTPLSSLEASSLKISVQSSSRKRTKSQQPNPPHRIEPPLNHPRRHNLRSKQSSIERASGGIQKKHILQMKHSMS